MSITSLDSHTPFVARRCEDRSAKARDDFFAGLYEYILFKKKSSGTQAKWRAASRSRKEYEKCGLSVSVVKTSSPLARAKISGTDPLRAA